MAGWDGDALAGQLEDALERQQQAAEARSRKKDFSPEETAREARRESLRLSRARIVEQLKDATNPVHRAMLERALHTIEIQMKD